MDNSQMSNLLNQSRLKVLKARDDMIVVSGPPLHHGYSQETRFTKPILLSSSWVYCNVIMSTSGLRFAFWCVFILSCVVYIPVINMRSP